MNASLATALGRPDLVFQTSGAGALRMGYPPVVGTVDSSRDPGLTGALSAGAPSVALAALVVGLVAFGWWVRPHLA